MKFSLLLTLYLVRKPYDVPSMPYVHFTCGAFLRWLRVCQKATHYRLDGADIKSRWGGRNFPQPSRPIVGPT